MAVALILGGLVLTCLCAFVWLWLWSWAGRAGGRGVVGKAALQLSAIGLAYGLLRGQLMSGIFYAAFPPFLLLQWPQVEAFSGFLSGLALAAAPYAAGVLILALVWRPTRVWAPGLAALALLFAALILGEGASQAAMCRSAAARGIATFQRNAFDWSLFNTPREFQVEIHAIATQNGQRLGFSYRTQDWYVIPPDATAEVIGPAFTCP